MVAEPEANVGVDRTSAVLKSTRWCLLLTCAVVGLGLPTHVLGAPRAPASPTIKIVQAPDRKTSSTKATFRFRTRARTTWCRRDGLPFERCRGSRTYRGLRPGRHTFTVQARRRGRITTVNYRWTVVARRRAPARELVFEEHFNGTSLDTGSWRAYRGPGHAGNGLRRPSAFSVENGLLVLTASWDGTNITSGGMKLELDQVYGIWEFRVRVEPDSTGQMSGVVLQWPQSRLQVPDGEQDMWETGHAVSRKPFYTYVHKSQNGVNDAQVRLLHDFNASAWHTVRYEWRRHSIRVWIDGQPSGSVTDPARIPTVPFDTAIQLDAFSNRPLDGPVKMYVDYLKIWR